MAKDGSYHVLEPQDEVERKIVSAVIRGRHAQFKHGETANGPRVRADLIRSLCLGEDPTVNKRFRTDEPTRDHHQECTPRCAVHISGITVVGPLDLSKCALGRSLHLSNCLFEDILDLRNTRTESVVRISECKLLEVRADRLRSTSDVDFWRVETGRGMDFTRAHISGNLNIDGSELGDTLSLASARVGGDLSLRGAKLNSVSGASLEGTHLIVEGELILEDNFTAKGKLALGWARVKNLRGTGAQLHGSKMCALEADNMHATGDILLDEIEAHGGVTLQGARAGDEIRLTGAKLTNNGGRALQAEQAAATNLYLDRGFISSGEISLTGAQLASNLVCTDATLDGSGGCALNAHLLKSGGSVYLNGERFISNGEVRLTEADIRNDLNCTDGTFQNPSGLALNAEEIATGRSVHLNRRFNAVGGVSLSKALVTSQFEICGGTVSKPGGTALDIAGITCRGDVMLRELEANGSVTLEGASIARNLDCQDAKFLVTRGEAFNGKEVEVGGTLVWIMREPCRGGVDLTFARARILKDDQNSWDIDDSLKLEGLTYDSLESPMSVDDRKAWLSKAEYAEQPYKQLIWAYQNSGKDSEAVDIVHAKHEAGRSRGKMSRWARLWDRFLGWSVGYGHRFHRPLFAILITGAVNTALFYSFNHMDVFHPTGSVTAGDGAGGSHLNSTECDATNNYPCFLPPVYAFEILIPVLNLRQVSYWLPTPDDALGVFLLTWVILNIVVGWLLGISVAAGVKSALGGDHSVASAPSPPSAGRE